MPKVSVRPLPLLAFLALAAVAVLAWALHPAKAEANNLLISTDYYFDAAKTQFAGHCVKLCNLQYVCSGTVTSYKIVESEPCG